MRQRVLICVILLLALFGGMQFFIQPVVLLLGVFLGWLAICWALWLGISQKISLPLWPVIKWPLAAALLAVLANQDIYRAGVGRLFLLAVGLAALVISRAYLTDQQIFDSFYYAGWWAWPAVYLLTYPLGLLYPLWAGHQNVLAFWGIIFVAVGLMAHSWEYFIIHLVMVITLGSRGALLGVAAVLLFYLWPVLRSRYSRVQTGLVGLLGLAGLIAARPGTSLVRLHYWQCAWAAFLSSPFFGVGLGGLKARQLIPEWGADYQIHAHNFLFSWLAQTGLMGLLGLAGAIWQIYKLQFYAPRWAWAILVGIAAHSLVDEPLFWPGPLLAAAITLSTIRTTTNGQ